MKKTSAWRLFLALALAWGAWIAVLYALKVYELALPRIGELYANTRELFLWQAAGFILLNALAAILRPNLVGRLAAGYLGVSTLVLLAFSREIWLPLAWATFLLWTLLAVRSVRLALHRLAGPGLATWGLAGGLLYCALFEISFFLGLFGMMTRWPVIVLAAAVAVPGAIHEMRRWRSSLRSIVNWLDALNPIGATALGAIWVALALAFVWACTPEIESDSMRTHIPYMQQLVRDGGLTAAPLDFQRLMVYGTRALFAAGLAVGSMDVARWLSWGCAVALVVLVSEEVTRRSGQRNLGVVAGAAVVTTPLILSLSRTLYHDHVITLLCLTAFVSLFRSFEVGSRAGAVLSAFAMGCAVQTKYNVLIFAFVWALALAILAVRRLRLAGGLRWLVLPLAGFAVAGCPWYVYTFATVGNPTFPYLNDWFGSPHWPAGQSTAFDHSTFTFGDGLSSQLLFPWLATFHSSQIDQYPDGRLGFVFLALLPFGWAFFDPRSRHGIGLGLAGLSGFLAICLRTPYARYWLPMYPLVLIPLFVALGASLSRARWRPGKPVAALAAVALFAGLLIPLPISSIERFGIPWKVYSKQVSESAWISTVFAGFPAVEQANHVLQPRDRVVVTGYEAVYTLAAEAYTLPFWMLRYYSVEDGGSFRDLLAKKEIRYWVVDHSTRGSEFFSRHAGGSVYWTEPRLVAAESNLGIYDVSSPAGPPRYSRIHDRRILPRILPAASAGAQDAAGWLDLHPDDSERSARTGPGSSGTVPAGGAIAYDFSLPAGSELCRVVIQGVRGADAGVVVLRFQWLDENRGQVGHVGGHTSYHRDDREAYFFGTVPPAARYGRLLVSPWQSGTLQLGETEIAFLRFVHRPGGPAF